jgi:hypothetical protein
MAKTLSIWQRQQDTGASLTLGQWNKLERDGTRIAFHVKPGRIIHDK